MKTKYPLYLYAFYPAMGASLYVALTIAHTALAANDKLHLAFITILIGTAYFVASLFAARKTVGIALEENVAETSLRGVFARTLYGNCHGRSDMEVDMLIDSTYQAAVTHFIPIRAKQYIVWRGVQFLLFMVAVFACTGVVVARPEASTQNLALLAAALGNLGLPCELWTMTRMWRPYQSDVTHWVAQHLGLEKTSSC
jgi:hypothetical protein